MGAIHLATLHMLFARYWPALLIIWGLIKLVEYQHAQRTGTQASGIGAGGVFLLIMLIVFGLIATQTSRVDWDSVKHGLDINDEDFPWFGHSYAYDDRLEQDFPTGASLRINNARGAVNISSSDSPKIQVSIHKNIKADSQGEADRWNSNSKPEIKVAGNVVSLNATNGDHPITIDLDITIPHNVAVSITNRSGDVSVLGRNGDVEVTNQKGDVAVSDVKGKVTLNLDRSSARVSQVTGDVSTEGKVNEISLGDIKGTVRLNGDFSENVQLSKIAKTVSLKSSRTEIEFAKIDGELSLDAHDLRASSVTGPLRILTKFKDIHLEGVSGDLRLDNEDGAVEVQMSKLGSMQINNRRSDVEIYVPDKAGFQLNARTKNGEIQSDFTGLSISNQDEQGVATGKVGTGGPQLVVNNEQGGIEIRKRSTLAESPKTPDAPEQPGVTEN
jgi:hypothetical protein